LLSRLCAKCSVPRVEIESWIEFLVGTTGAKDMVQTKYPGVEIAAATMVAHYDSYLPYAPGHCV